MLLFSKIDSKEQALKEVKICSLLFCILIALFFPGYIGSTIDTDYALIGIYGMDMLLMIIMIVLFATLKSQIGAVLIASCAVYFFIITVINFHFDQWQSYYFITLYSIMAYVSYRATYVTYLLDSKFKQR